MNIEDRHRCHRVARLPVHPPEGKEVAMDEKGKRPRPDEMLKALVGQKPLSTKPVSERSYRADSMTGSKPLSAKPAPAPAAAPKPEAAAPSDKKP